MSAATTAHELAALLGPGGVLSPAPREYLTEASGPAVGRADAVVLPETAEQVAAVVRWCYERDVSMVPRGGGTGYAGGTHADGGVVIALDRMVRVRQFDPLLWRIHVEAGLRTGDLRRIVRESGLFFPPDPGAAEQSQIGGNLATNAGGPHAFKYGVTGRWVTGAEAVIAPGEVVQIGGASRKDVAGYDLKSLLIGSEGSLGIITAAWLRLIPAPEAAHPVVAFYPTAQAGCEAIETVFGSGIEAAALEYLDEGAFAIARGAYPGTSPERGFMVIAEADGTEHEAARVRDELVGVLEEGALAVEAPDAASLWRWREGVSLAVMARRGAKLAEDVAVPLDRLAEAVQLTVEIGERHGLEAVSWGHAGDGNLHSNFLFEPDGDGRARADAAARELLTAVVALGGTISGEHGIGTLKRPYLADQLSPPLLGAMHAVKRALDPKGLFNPGKAI
ncbi:MAG: glycolate oxidase [Gaiellales bacterium]|jgi:glycolate oxidase subunit GlcD|nr:glycolate oxidase [Gaiellales bacterium]